MNLLIFLLETFEHVNCKVGETNWMPTHYPIYYSYNFLSHSAWFADSLSHLEKYLRLFNEIASDSCTPVTRTRQVGLPQPKYIEMENIMWWSAYTRPQLVNFILIAPFCFSVKVPYRKYFYSNAASQNSYRPTVYCKIDRRKY